MRRLFSRISIFSGLISVLFVVLWQTLDFDIPDQCLSIAPNSSQQKIYHDISDHYNLAKTPWLYAYFRLLTVSKTLHHGEYCSHHDTYSTLLRKVAGGQEAQHVLRIVPGSHAIDMINDIRKDHPHLNNNLSTLDVKALAGQLLPESYFYTSGDSLVSVLERAKRSLKQKLIPIWEHRDDSVHHFDFDQLLVMASLLEKEASDFDDRKKIAGVLLNRLNHQQRLQVDASVIAAFYQEYTSGQSLSKLIKRDHPLNTYRHRGLPPYPIAYVSESAFKAACHPELHSYLFYYYDGNKHFYSELYRDHLLAVKKSRHT